MINLWQAHVSFAMLAFLLLPAFGLPRWPRVALLGVLLAASFLPVGGLSLAAHLRSYIDDLALTTLVFMAWGCLRRLNILGPAPQDKTSVLVTFAVLALALYPATLGLSDLDPYRFGYSPRPMLIGIALLTIGLFYQRNGLGVAMLAGATLAFMLGIKQSQNYWDYLIDPPLGLYCCVALLIAAARRLITWLSTTRNNATRSA
ncbi:hypothetical protein [Pseudomonas syringae]|uniref:Membrane protein n=1 Tax=Pseudomonas syringae TaxID=317 RepID=A0A085VI47_PSESX|nr:hypothetical protein [Pseudomonas syringae]KFE55110.1 membrane protein [Pseudomonas syringae]